MTYALLHGLLGQTVVGLSQVALDQPDDSPGGSEIVVLRDTLIFALDTGRRFELLVSHTDVLFEEIIPGPADMHAEERGKAAMARELEGDDESDPPTWTYAKEVWTTNGSTKFLVFASYDLLPGQTYQAHEVKLDHAAWKLPWTIASITEMWGGEDQKRFFAAAVLWDQDGQPLLAIYRRTDEVDLMSIDTLHRQIDHMTLYTETILHRRYTI